MAFTTHPAPASFGATLATWIAPVARAFTALFQGLMRAGEINATAHRRLAEAERLHAKTDAELAAMNLTREDIAQHVFRDLFWH